MGEISTQFGIAMGAGSLLVYAVWVLLFSSFVRPITFLRSLPLAIGGAIFTLYIYGAGIGLSVIMTTIAMTVGMVPSAICCCRQSCHCYLCRRCSV